ncbi:MAG: penicillin-binding protein activator LpoB [Verrucomicrobiales bacterium]|jgi:PBP1b-binding outer membrane lipoprotein LpoB|nr:penicillin-binding protein activator LpoB [Verrucomicrobiales bacterium]
MKKQLLFLGLGGVLLASCAQDDSVRYVDPGQPGRVAGTGIESQDLAAAAQKAAQSIVNLPAIANAVRPPVILITPVTNRSASPVDATLYTTKLRGALMQYSPDKARFLARDASWNTNQQEQGLRQAGAVADGGTAASGRQGATYDYILTAELQGISTATGKGQSDYFLIAFKLVNYQDLLIWENQYEIKKEGREAGVYR